MLWARCTDGALIRGPYFKKKGMTKDEMWDGITDSMDMSLSKFKEMVEDRGVWSTAAVGLQRVRYDLVTEKQPL